MEAKDGRIGCEIEITTWTECQVVRVGEGLSFTKSARPYVFTKCGVVFDSGSPGKRPQRIGTAASIRKELEQSLRRLRVEIIDLYQMHWPPRDGTPVEDYWQTLLDLKREGKVRAVGLSNHDIAALEQVNSWVEAATVELTSGELTDIRLAIEHTGAGSGPLHA